MVLRTLGYPAFIAVILAVFVSMAPAFAQTGGTDIQSNSSSGLKVSISKIIVDQRNVSIQFVAVNTTKARIYIEDVVGDQSQKAFLGSGVQFEWPTVLGLEQCPYDIVQCNNSTQFTSNLTAYSYIEPGDFLSFMFTYQSNSPVSNNDTISFSVVLMARFSTLNEDPAQTGAMNILRLNFPFVPLS